MFLSYGMTWNVEGTSGYMESRTPRPKIARVIRASRLRGTEGAWSGPRYSSIPARPATAGKTTYVSPQRPAEGAGTYRRNTAPMSDNGLVSNGRSMPVPHEIIVRCLPVRSSPVSNLLHLRDTQRTNSDISLFHPAHHETPHINTSQTGSIQSSVPILPAIGTDPRDSQEYRRSRSEGNHRPRCGEISTRQCPRVQSRM